MKHVNPMMMVGICFVLTGCIHNTPYDLAAAERTQPSITQVSDESATQMAEAAASVSQSLTNLEAVEKANMVPSAAKLYPAVGQVVIPGISSIDWNGPIEPLVRQIAKATNYHVRIVGSAPITPIVVMVHEDQAANADILRNAALQAGNRATIKTNPAAKIIELRYLGS